MTDADIDNVEEGVPQPTPYRNPSYFMEQASELEEEDQDSQEIDTDEEVEASQATQEDEDNSGSDEEETFLARKDKPHDFKKRYDDLKKHYDKRLDQWKLEKGNYEERLKTETRKSQLKLPKTEEELETFKQQYPDVYAVVETVSHMQADDRVRIVENKIEDLKKQEHELIVQNAEQELITLQPDFPTLKEDKKFVTWLADQPESISDGIYKNRTDARWAARVIDLYKADTGVRKKSKTKRSASEAVSRTSRGDPPTTDAGEMSFRASDIAKMKPWEFEQHEVEIDKAHREGRVIQDL
jgi:hypothetical protein